jgi:hypothetical protein
VVCWFQAFLLFLYDYLSYIVCHTHVYHVHFHLQCMQLPCKCTNHTTRYYLLALSIHLTVHIITVYCQNRNSSTAIGVQGIIVNSPFTCSGFLSRWEMCFASDPSLVNYNITVQLWEPLDSSCFKLQWSNRFLPGNDSNSEFLIQRWRTRCINISMPEPREIPVLPDYTIGFQVSIIGTNFSNQGGLLRTSPTNDDTVYYIKLEDIDVGEYDKFCSGSVSRQRTQRPLIRAIVGECSQCLSVYTLCKYKNKRLCVELFIVVGFQFLFHHLLYRLRRCVSLQQY